MERFTTINGVDMIQMGDYNWIILKETDDTEVYQIVLSHPENNITVLYGVAEGNMTVQYTNTLLLGGSTGDMFIFKIPFDATPMLINALLLGEECTLMPIYHIDTVIKN